MNSGSSQVVWGGRGRREVRGGRRKEESGDGSGSRRAPHIVLCSLSIGDERMEGKEEIIGMALASWK